MRRCSPRRRRSAVAASSSPARQQFQRRETSVNKVLVTAVARDRGSSQRRRKTPW